MEAGPSQEYLKSVIKNEIKNVERILRGHFTLWYSSRASLSVRSYDSLSYTTDSRVSLGWPASGALLWRRFLLHQHPPTSLYKIFYKDIWFKRDSCCNAYLSLSLSLSLERGRVLLFSISSFPLVLLRFLSIGKNRRADQSADKSNSPILFSLFFFFFSRRSLKTHPNYYNRGKKNIKEREHNNNNKKTCRDRYGCCRLTG